MVIFPDSRITYAELDAATHGLAAAFIDASVSKGTRVGLIMHCCVQWVQIAMALTRIGAVLVPLSTLLQAPELVAQLRVASVRYLVAVEEFRSYLYLDDPEPELTNLPALQSIWTADDLPPLNGGAVLDATAGTVTASDTLAIMFTREGADGMAAVGLRRPDSPRPHRQGRRPPATGPARRSEARSPDLADHAAFRQVFDQRLRT